MQMISDAVPDIVLRGHTDAISCLNFREEYIFSCSNNSAILWDVKIQRACLTMDNIHSSSIVSCGILSTSEKGFTSGRDGILRLWNFEDNTEISSFYSGCFHFCNAAVVNEESLIFAACSEEEKVVLWDARANQIIGTLQSPSSEGKHGMVTSLATNFLSLPYHIVAGFEDGCVSIGDLRMLQFITSLPPTQSQPIISTAISSKDATLAVGNSCELIELFSKSCGDIDSTSNIINYEKRAIFEVSSGTSCLSFRKDGRVMVSSHWDGSINVFDTKKNKYLARIKYYTSGLSGICFCDSSNKRLASRFASAGKNNEIAIWNIF